MPSRGPLDQGQLKELHISSNHLLKAVTQDLNFLNFIKYILRKSYKNLIKLRTIIKNDD